MSFFTKEQGYDVGVMAGRPPIKQATDFGKRVAAARRRRELTQQQLADIIGVNQRMVDYYERRAENVKTEVVVKLAHALEVSADELLGIKPMKRRPGRKSKLHKQLEQLERLPKAQQKSIIQVLEMALKSA